MSLLFRQSRRRPQRGHRAEHLTLDLLEHRIFRDGFCQDLAISCEQGLRVLQVLETLPEKKEEEEKKFRASRPSVTQGTVLLTSQRALAEEQKAS